MLLSVELALELLFFKRERMGPHGAGFKGIGSLVHPCRPASSTPIGSGSPWSQAVLPVHPIWATHWSLQGSIVCFDWQQLTSVSSPITREPFTGALSLGPAMAFPEENSKPEAAL